ncbi:MAG: outer membrane beta-barrel protein [Terracidiphilus sp.]
MRSKFIPLMVFAALTVVVALPLSAQSYPSAKQGGWPLMIGGGMSIFNMDFPPRPGKTLMEGGTIWADWTRIPFVPRQLGIIAEYRDLGMNAPSFAPGLRSKVFLGGPTYTWRRSRFAADGKGMIGYASIDFPPFGSYSHDTRTIKAVGVGVQYRVWNSVSARVDYEYQWWPTLASVHPHPNGFTFGLAYDFHTVGRRY